MSVFGDGPPDEDVDPHDGMTAWEIAIKYYLEARTPTPLANGSVILMMECFAGREDIETLEMWDDDANFRTGLGPNDLAEIDRLDIAGIAYTRHIEWGSRRSGRYNYAVFNLFISVGLDSHDVFFLRLQSEKPYESFGIWRNGKIESFLEYQATQVDPNAGEFDCDPNDDFKDAAR